MTYVFHEVCFAHLRESMTVLESGSGTRLQSFLQLCSRSQFPGFRIPRAKFSRIPLQGMNRFITFSCYIRLLSLMRTKFNGMGHLFKLTKFKYNQDCHTNWSLRPLKERD